MKRISYLISIIFIFYFLNTTLFAQDFTKFSISGGPIIGWYVPSMEDLNSELQKMGIPNMSTSGMLSVGGGGFIIIPGLKKIRIGGIGYGFSTEEAVELQNTIKSAKFSYSGAALSVEYFEKISKNFDIAFGGLIGYGTLGLNIAKYPKDYKNWNIGSFTNDTIYANQILVNDYTKKIITLQPQVSLGYDMFKFLYLKLSAGYSFSVTGKWKLNDLLEVNNIPSGIKADGFSFTLGIQAGLFIK